VCKWLHVAENALADVVQMIEFDDVFTTGRFLVAPVPTHRNRRVVEIMNMVCARSGFGRFWKMMTPMAGAKTRPS